MSGARVEYVGFTVGELEREYTLRVWAASGAAHDFQVAIANEAFLTRSVRYQDAPEVCFIKLNRELLACGDALPALRLAVSRAELEEYRTAHAPKPAKRRPKPPIPS
jgi:hypothetical protein